MSMDSGRPRTPKFFKRFEICFGRLFLAIGAGTLLMAAVLFLVLRDEPGMGSRIWAFLISPLTLGVILLAVGASYLRRVRYAFDDLHGTPREGQSSCLSEGEVQSYQIGEQVFIRYDPEQPSESIWLGREELTEQY